MKKILIICVLAIAAIPAYLLLSGTISVSSFAMILNVMSGKGIDTPSGDVIENRIKVADGFGLSVYASDLPNARFILMTANRDLLVTRPHKGDLVLIRANKEDASKSGARVTLLEGLNKPSGVVVAEGWLFVGESDAIGRIAFDESTGTVSGEYERVLEGLSGDGNHPYKQIKRGPDGKIYLAQGSTCNVCIEPDSRRGTMGRFDLEGKNFEVIATGLRNTMGFDWAPWNGDLYGTDNGRDLLGDDYPPCELNLIAEGNFYGWPYYNGSNDPDPDFNPEGKGVPAELAANPVAPVHEFRAHNAPLGMTFVNAEGWPDQFKQSALVALHGSWNRSIPDGYRVVSLHWLDGKIERKDFLSGFELEGDVIGRPVDVTQGPDGAVYISDDYAGAIYRMAYGEEQQTLETSAAQAPFELQQPEWLTAENTNNYKAEGERLFKKFHCQSCHNPDFARGNMDLTSVNQRLQYSDVIDRLTKPRAPMPVFPLSQDDKKALAVWLMGQ